MWNRKNPGAGEYTGSAARNVGKSLIPNDGGDLNLHTCAALLTKREVKVVGYWQSSFLCVYASDKSSCAQPSPLGHWGTFAYLVSPGCGALSNFAWPGGRALAHPELLTRTTWISILI